MTGGELIAAGEYDWGRIREDGLLEIDASAEIVEGQLKRGHAGRWEIICDEGEALNGFDVAPAPLQYYALGVLF